MVEPVVSIDFIEVTVRDIKKTSQSDEECVGRV